MCNCHNTNKHSKQTNIYTRQMISVDQTKYTFEGSSNLHLENGCPKVCQHNGVFSKVKFVSEAR